MKAAALTRSWQLAFYSLIVLYGIIYAPYGINETDGGFLTGLAWQLVQGKMLYQDVVYVRPPLPVWLRALELWCLPERWAVLGERWICYLKIGLYSGLAAALLAQGRARWQLAAFGFVVSVHCYPAAAWHTIDGISCAVLAAYLLLHRPGRWLAFWAGLALAAACLCKQSFYPLPVFALAAAGFSPERRSILSGLIAGLTLGIVLLFIYLQVHQLTAGLLRMTGGAASGGQGLQHGLLDYLRLRPDLAFVSLLLLTPVAVWFWRGRSGRLAFWCWTVWLGILIGSYGWSIWENQDFTVPFAQSRLLFLVTAAYLLVCFRLYGAQPILIRVSLLLSVSWCAALSWGYNLPILCATPWVWTALELSRQLQAYAPTARIFRPDGWSRIIALLALLAVFRCGYEFVYRDGRRSAMTEDMEKIFPALTGIYSDPETAATYRELRMLSIQYGPNMKTLPAFPQASFLTGALSPLPLDWVVSREMGVDSVLIMNKLLTERPVLLIEKRYLNAIETDPQLSLVHQAMQIANRVGETNHFLILQLPPTTQ